MILIYSDQENAQVGLPAGHFGGEQVLVPNPNHYRRLDGEAVQRPVTHGSEWMPERTYTAVGHFLAVDTESPDLASHDAELILALPGFRLANANEQNAFAAAEQQQEKAATSLKENGGAGGGKSNGNGKAEKPAAAAVNGG